MMKYRRIVVFAVECHGFIYCQRPHLYPIIPPRLLFFLFHLWWLRSSVIVTSLSSGIFYFHFALHDTLSFKNKLTQWARERWVCNSYVPWSFRPSFKIGETTAIFQEHGKIPVAMRRLLEKRLVTTKWLGVYDFQICLFFRWTRNPLKKKTFFIRWISTKIDLNNLWSTGVDQTRTWSAAKPGLC